MPPQTRRSSLPKIVIGRESESEESSSDSEAENEEDDDGASEMLSEEENGVKETEEMIVENAKKKAKIPITISLKKVCKVCKGTGHEAGFKGATYIDCPKKPCFLCKTPGHTTMTCPHRVATEHGVIPAPRRNTQKPLDYIFERQLRTNVPAIKLGHVVPDQLDAAVIRLHSRRVTCLEFHPTNNNILLSGDKKGQLGIWNFCKVNERTVYETVHRIILNSMKFNPINDGTLFTAASDGTICLTDLETGISDRLMDLNPNGWNGVANWRMLYGLDICWEKNLVLVSDNFGYLYFLDQRSKKEVGEPVLIHKRGTKVVGLHCNPLQPELLLTCGNDHFARIWDLRRLEAGASLCSMGHKRVVNSAYFSPHSGSKILTTSQDNRIRIWDCIFGNLETPSREIVHSHDFNRHLTCFRAEWDPKDLSESLAVIGRYISENYDGVALHPIDFVDTNTGQLVAEVMDPDVKTISPVNKLHPRDDILATGSSRSVFIWRPKEKSKSESEEVEERKYKILICGKEGKKGNKKVADGSDDDNDIGGYDACHTKGKRPKSSGKGRKVR
ncbi:protein DAMAGED DNA-BINDING 2 [Aristolochia californica]|uniref:protein DAMAGED DNA-BINDING 2 n=1 Tax=Aristolochia californica TaxID=171875 RepID=UPI0035E38503